MTEIAGLNLFEFVVYSWLLVSFLAWLCDNGPELSQNAKAAYREKFPKKTNPETTVEMPVGSFDPDETMKLPRIKKGIQVVHITKSPVDLPRRRHAKD